ncbi:MAG: hypothetical protein CSYNP_03794 [Syntrophus sp. SKADARSKE-3]|nr:hypothetical protein [Syntrophus sp. SKADARSKE-3]
MMACLSLPCQPLQAGTIYKYIDKDGSVVYTDNPPPGIKAQPQKVPRALSASEMQALDKQKTLSTEADAKQKARAESIQAAKADYEKAQEELQRYQFNKNQSIGDFTAASQWEKRVEEQRTVIEQKRKLLESLEQAP